MAKKDSVMELEESTPTITPAQHREHEQVIMFLDKYGIDTEGMSYSDAMETYERIQKLVDEQVQVLSRGQVNDTLERLIAQYIEKGFTGEYFHNSPTEIDRAIAMGWNPVISEKANKDSSTGSADNFVRVGDLVLMQKPTEEYAAGLIARDRKRAARRARRKLELDDPSQGGTDPLGSRIPGAHPDHPLKPLSHLQK